MEVYDSIAEGFKKNLSGADVGEYLRSLQKSVKALRVAYRNSPVSVPYENTEIQAAYLAAYLPHYYQLIYKIFIEEVPEIFQGKKDVHLTFIGGGPGSEAYGAIKYIVNNCPSVKNIYVTILDINAETWAFSHSIVQGNLISGVVAGKVNVHWRTSYFNLVTSDNIVSAKDIIGKSDLLVIQNCLNEIASTYYIELKRNIKLLFDFIPGNSFLLMSDLTSGARPVLRMLEQFLVSQYSPKFSKTTLHLSSSISLLSVHHRPSAIFLKNLLVGSDGLIPRKYIKYDYSLLSKGLVEAKRDNTSLGFNAIYRPLDFKMLDANDYIHNKIFLGIDFGTSSTVISTAQLVDGKIRINPIPIQQKDHSGTITTSALVPTVISLVNGNRLLVGTHAAAHKPFLEYGINTWHSFKQNLSQIENIDFPKSALINNPTFKIANATDGLTLFFSYLKKEVFEYLRENSLLSDVEYSISVPAGFSSKEKKALKSCLIAAGIECEDTPFIEEPNAALINHLFEQDIFVNNKGPQRILVLDLGAGTVDVSIMLIENGAEGFTSKLLSVVRLGAIGGNLIDEKVAELILKKSGLRSGVNSSAVHELLSICETLKIKLCKSVITDSTVNYLLPETSTSKSIVTIQSSENLQSIGIASTSITFEEFDKIMDEYWNGSNSAAGIKTTIDRALKNALLDLRSIGKVIVTGGGGRNPYIKNKVSTYFKQSEVFISDNIQEQVSRGVALQSFVLNSFGKNIITPILSHNIFLKADNASVKLFENGISVPSDDVNVFILEKNEDQVIFCYSEDSPDYQKFYLLPQKAVPAKLVFYIAPDQELKCELIGEDFETEAKEVFVLPDLKLITLK